MDYITNSKGLIIAWFLVFLIMSCTKMDSTIDGSWHMCQYDIYGEKINRSPCPKYDQFLLEIKGDSAFVNRQTIEEGIIHAELQKSEKLLRLTRNTNSCYEYEYISKSDTLYLLQGYHDTAYWGFHPHSNVHLSRDSSLFMFPVDHMIKFPQIQSSSLNEYLLDFITVKYPIYIVSSDYGMNFYGIHRHSILLDGYYSSIEDLPIWLGRIDHYFGIKRDQPSDIAIFANNDTPLSLVQEINVVLTQFGIERISIGISTAPRVLSKSDLKLLPFPTGVPLKAQDSLFTLNDYINSPALESIFSSRN